MTLLALYVFAIDLWRVPTDDPQLTASILPTLAAGDVVATMRHFPFGRGNLVRCPDPQAVGRYVLARAIGEEGDALAIEGETVIIDGHRNSSIRPCDAERRTVTDPSSGEDVDLECTSEEFGESRFEALHARSGTESPTRTKVEKGKWFLVSDNRHIHLDSRDFGQVDPGACQHVFLRLFGEKGVFDLATRLTVLW
jgi:signal peptidase I